MSLLSPEQIAQLKELLLQQKTRLEESLKINEKNSEPIALDPAVFGRLSRMDAIQQQKMAEATMANNQLHLQRIEAALVAIDEGTYGECKSCGEGIPLARLQARPESFICIDCKQSRE